MSNWSKHQRHVGIQQRKTKSGVVYRARVKVAGKLKLSETTLSLREAIKTRDQFTRQRDAVKKLGSAPKIKELVLENAGSARSVEAKRHTLQRWETYVEPFLVDRDLYMPEQIDKRVLSEFVLHLDTYRYKAANWKGDKALSRSTKVKILKILHGALRKAFTEGLIESIPARPSIQGDTSTYNVNMTLAQLHTILKLAPDPPFPHRAMVIFAVITGMDWGMCAGINRGDVDGPIRIGAMLHYDRSKTGRDGKIPLTARLARELLLLNVQHSLPHEPMFKNPKTGARITTIKKWLQTASCRAGVPGATFHSFRHFAITNNMTVLGDANRVATLSVHSNPKVIHDFYDKSGGTAEELSRIETSLFGDSSSFERNSVTVPLAYALELVSRLKRHAVFVNDARFLESLTSQHQEFSGTEKMRGDQNGVQTDGANDNQRGVK